MKSITQAQFNALPQVSRKPRNAFMLNPVMQEIDNMQAGAGMILEDGEWTLKTGASRYLKQFGKSKGRVFEVRYVAGGGIAVQRIA
jgi:hypothetical protein